MSHPTVTKKPPTSLSRTEKEIERLMEVIFDRKYVPIAIQTAEENAFERADQHAKKTNGGKSASASEVAFFFEEFFPAELAKVLPEIRAQYRSKMLKEAHRLLHRGIRV